MTDGHDTETYENKDLKTAFISREEHEQLLKQERNKAIDDYYNKAVAELDKVQGSWSYSQVKVLLESIKK